MKEGKEHIPAAGMLLFGFLLVAHLADWEHVRVDTTAILLLLGFLLIPFIDQIRRIKIGDVEAEIAPREVEAAVASVERELGPDEPEALPPGKGESGIVSLAREDPRLGLAKLRIEIESSLKSLDRLGEPQQDRRRHGGISALLRGLERRDRIPHELGAAIRDVLPLANRAVHGEHVSREDAEELAYLGVRILEGLKDTYADQVSEVIESREINPQKMRSMMYGRYRVETVVPLVESPLHNVRILDQEALSQFLENYEEYAEFLVGIERIDED